MTHSVTWFTSRLSCEEQGVGLDDLMGPFQLELFYKTTTKNTTESTRQLLRDTHKALQRISKDSSRVYQLRLSTCTAQPKHVPAHHLQTPDKAF